MTITTRGPEWARMRWRETEQSIARLAEEIGRAMVEGRWDAALTRLNLLSGSLVSMRATLKEQVRLDDNNECKRSMVFAYDDGTVERDHCRLPKDHRGLHARTPVQ